MNRSVNYDSAALARVAKGSLCSGCGGCALVAPEKVAMNLEPPGFLRPRQNAPLSETEESRILEICPGLGQSVDPQNQTDSVLWGPFVDMRVGNATDQNLRFTASSGGALSAILTHLLESGQVDAVLHNGADPGLPIANMPVISTDASQVLTGAGSRYAPSAPLAGLIGQIDTNRRFAFVGKPCDVAALRALSGIDRRIADRVPVLLSFFCGGVPSLAGAEKIVEGLGATLAETQEFRYRGFGWPGRATATLADGSTPSMSYHDSWGQILSHHVQHRCKICADGAGIAADIVCADAWESDENGYPVFEERDGTSLIVARTPLGKEIIDAVETAGAIETQSFSVEKLPSIQTGQAFRRRSLLARLCGLALLGRPIPNYKGLHLLAAARQNSVTVNMRNFLGMVRRVVQGRVR